MELTENSSKILFHLNDPVVSFDINGMVIYTNEIARNISQLTEININDELSVTLFDFLDVKGREIKDSAVVRKVEILDSDFKDEFYEMNLRYDFEDQIFVCFFRNITEKIQLENQIKLNQILINEQIEELTSNNDVLRKKNEIINIAQEDIRSSLRYGKAIQDKINANQDQLSKLFPKSYSFYKPQNYIGGDLIWARDSKFGKIIAVVDCMGHGVPGAMLAMSVFHVLNTTLSEGKFESVTEFLCNVTNSYFNSFFDRNKEDDFGDTFDIAICVVDQKSNIIRYRGIKRPMIIDREGDLYEFKGDRVSVSDAFASQKIKKEPWDKVWPYKEGDKLYMFTDGFTDQFGGIKNKKYKYVNLKKFIKNISNEDISKSNRLFDQELWDWQNTYKESFEQTDDITVLGVEL